jgi:hypothetical protein
MDSPFILNPRITVPTIKDAIHERMSKLSGVLTCLMYATEFIQDDQGLDRNSIYHTLWAMEGFLDEVNCLQQQLMTSLQ